MVLGDDVIFYVKAELADLHYVPVGTQLLVTVALPSSCSSRERGHRLQDQVEAYYRTRLESTY